MAILNKVQGAFSEDRYAHQHFIFLPRTLQSVERERIDVAHQLSDDFEQAGWDHLTGDGSRSCSAEAYWTHLLGA